MPPQDDAQDDAQSTPAAAAPDPDPSEDNGADETEASPLERRREALREKLGDLPSHEIAGALEGFYAPEIAEILDNYPLEDQLRVLQSLPPEEAAEIFEEMKPDDQAELLDDLSPAQTQSYVEDMKPDDLVDLLEQLSHHQSEHLLAMLPAEDQAEARQLMSYGENTAGGRMTTDFAWLAPEDTVGRALEKLRTDFKDVEMLYYLYVLDPARRILGLVTLRHLLSQAPDAIIGKIMAPNVIAMPPEADQEEVARELAIYDFFAMPIVDRDERMLGIITFDDLLDVAVEEAVEDQELFGGVSPSEDPYMQQTLWQGGKQRFPWLMAFLVLSSGSTFVLSAFAHAGYTGDFFLYAVALVPMIAAMAGNAATQTATLVIRAIAIQDIKPRHALGVLWRELRLGFLMGLALSLPAFGRAMMASGDYGVYLGCALAASVVIVMGISTMTGALLPILFKSMGLDPAVMSSPFIATIIDIVTITIYFSIAVLIHEHFLIHAVAAAAVPGGS
jgi:magnesium transporter